MAPGFSHSYLGRLSAGLQPVPPHSAGYDLPNTSVKFYLSLSKHEDLRALFLHLPSHDLQTKVIRLFFFFLRQCFTI